MKYVVDDYLDQVRPKSESAVEAILQRRHSSQGELLVFDSPEEAWMFIFGRALGAVLKAENELSKAKRRLARVQAKAKATKGA